MHRFVHKIKFGFGLLQFTNVPKLNETQSLNLVTFKVQLIVKSNVVNHCRHCSV